MEARIKALILELEREVQSANKQLEGIQDRDIVGINVMMSLISTKESFIQKLKSLIN